MSKKFKFNLLAICLLVIIVSPVIMGQILAPNRVVATGTVTSGDASILDFGVSMTGLVIIENRNATGEPVYVKFQDNATTPTVSAEDYDKVVEVKRDLNIGPVFLSKHPFSRIGVFTEAATPKVKARGWQR